MKNALFVLLLLSGYIVACRSEALPTETPKTVSTFGRPPFETNQVSPVTLLRNPTDFLKRDIQLSGQYQPLPILVCGNETHRSPATWLINAGEAEILASGFDQPLRELANPGLELVVEGQWQRWQGQVGCGPGAPTETVWYLEVTDIVSPNPLVASSIAEVSPVETAETTETEVASPEATADATATRSAQLTEEARPATEPAEAEMTDTPTPATLPPTGSTDTPTPTYTPFVTPSDTPTRTTTPLAEASPTRTSTATPTASATAQSTATRANTPTATTIAGDSTPIGYEDLIKRMISANDTHTYRFVATNGDSINIAAAPTAGLDVSLELIGPNGSTLQTAGSAGAGQPESLGPYNITNGGVHLVKVSSGSSSGNYAVVVQTLDALPFIVFQGNINFGGTVTGATPVDTDHMFNFMASEGDFIRIESSATTNTDLILYLNGPDSIEIDFADEDFTIGPPNDEELIQVELSADGLYTIGVGEIDFEAIGYTITLLRLSS